MIESGQHLASFAFDEDSNVRFVVAKYTKDKEIIELLSKDKNEAVRYMIALIMKRCYHKWQTTAVALYGRR